MSEIIQQRPPEELQKEQIAGEALEKFPSDNEEYQTIMVDLQILLNNESGRKAYPVEDIQRIKEQRPELKEQAIKLLEKKQEDLQSFLEKLQQTI